MRGWPVLLCTLLSCSFQEGESDVRRSDGGSAEDSGGVPQLDAGGPAAQECAPLPDPTGVLVPVGPDDDFVSAVNGALPGTTVLFADGVYDLEGKAFRVQADDVTIRSESGNPDAVILDANFANSSAGVFMIVGVSNTTLAEFTVRRAALHQIFIGATSGRSSLGTKIYRIKTEDQKDPAVRIVPAPDLGTFADEGEILCSDFTITPLGESLRTTDGAACGLGGIQAVQAEGWRVANNHFDGFWCQETLGAFAVSFSDGSRDTLIENNTFDDCASSIGFGVGGVQTNARTFADDPCSAITRANHYGGLVRNNRIAATGAELFGSSGGMDTGISVSAGCDAVVAHNTVASSVAPFSSIEWRFAETTVDLTNNLTTHQMRARNGGIGTRVGNLDNASASNFVDLAGHDLHLSDDASARGAGSDEGITHAPVDFEGDLRISPLDVGADQRSVD